MNNLIGKRIDVLDKGWIELLDVMPHPLSGITPDQAVVNGARVSFLGESKGDEKDAKLIDYLMRHRHTSPFEQVEFKFRLKCPLVTWWQLTRHRTLSLNLQSGRYTEFDEGEFYIPDEWRLQSKDNKQASEGAVDEQLGDVLTQSLIAHYEQSYRHYEFALSRGVAREMARFFLPAFGVYYSGVVKVDAHNLMHFLKLRMAQEAQHEIRVYAQAIYTEFFKPAMPVTASAFERYELTTDNAP